MQLLTLTKPESTAAEAYRTLRTSLHFAALEAPIKTLLIAAPDSAEASADALANLAVVCAQIDQRVIAVDANLRVPQLHRAFGVDLGLGLGEALQQTDLPRPALRSTSVPSLRVLTAGSAKIVASDAIASARMGALLQGLKQDADLVLINAAPSTRFSDAALLASTCDAAVLIASANKTRRDALEHARDAMQQARARLLGVVLTHAS